MNRPGATDRWDSTIGSPCQCAFRSVSDNDGVHRVATGGCLKNRKPTGRNSSATLCYAVSRRCRRRAIQENMNCELERSPDSIEWQNSRPMPEPSRLRLHQSQTRLQHAGYLLSDARRLVENVRQFGRAENLLSALFRTGSIDAHTEDTTPLSERQEGPVCLQQWPFRPFRRIYASVHSHVRLESMSELRRRSAKSR
jgi:hypothetical protein